MKTTSAWRRFQHLWHQQERRRLRTEAELLRLRRAFQQVALLNRLVANPLLNSAQPGGPKDASGVFVSVLKVAARPWLRLERLLPPLRPLRVQALRFLLLQLLCRGLQPLCDRYLNSVFPSRKRSPSRNSKAPLRRFLLKLKLSWRKRAAGILWRRRRSKRAARHSQRSTSTALTSRPSMPPKCNSASPSPR